MTEWEVEARAHIARVEKEQSDRTKWIPVTRWLAMTLDQIVMRKQTGALKCGKCSQELNGYNVCVFDVDGADQCEDGRFESPTYSLVIKCHNCESELLRQDRANSDYGERVNKQAADST